MPFKIRKAPRRELYWVVNTVNGRKFSGDPIPLENARSQLRILENWALENRPEDSKTFIQEVVSNMKTGAFTKQAKKAGMDTEAFADYVLKNPDFFTLKTRRRAQFLVNIRPKANKVKGGAWSRNLDTRIEQFKKLMTDNYEKLTNREEFLEFRLFFNKTFEENIRSFVPKMTIVQKEGLDKYTLNLIKNGYNKFKVTGLPVPEANDLPTDKECRLCFENVAENQLYSSDHSQTHSDKVCINCYNRLLLDNPSNFQRRENVVCPFCRHRGYGKC